MYQCAALKLLGKMLFPVLLRNDFVIFDWLCKMYSINSLTLWKLEKKLIHAVGLLITSDCTFVLPLLLDRSSVLQIFTIALVSNHFLQCLVFITQILKMLLLEMKSFEVFALNHSTNCNSELGHLIWQFNLQILIVLPYPVRLQTRQCHYI